MLQLLVGLTVFGVGCAVMVRADIGVDPWTVFAQGIAVHTGWGLGWIVNITGLLVLLAWIPLRQRPGIGTLANILLVGTSMQLALDLLPPISGFAAQVGVFVGGILLVGLGSGVYIGARLGPGPRDGLMTGLHARLGWPLWLCRFSVEASVLALGWALGGSVGLGTVLFAALIGPVVGVTVPWFDRRARPAPGRPGGRSARDSVQVEPRSI